MSETSLTEWECCEVLHAGDGPEHRPWETVVSSHPVLAIEAAKEFARDNMTTKLQTHDICAGDSVYVAVKMSPDRNKLFCCDFHVEVKADAWAYRDHVELTLTIIKAAHAEKGAGR